MWGCQKAQCPPLPARDARAPPPLRARGRRADNKRAQYQAELHAAQKAKWEAAARTAASKSSGRGWFQKLLFGSGEEAAPQRAAAGRA